MTGARHPQLRVQSRVECSRGESESAILTVFLPLHPQVPIQTGQCLFACLLGSLPTLLVPSPPFPADHHQLLSLSLPLSPHSVVDIRCNRHTHVFSRPSRRSPTGTQPPPARSLGLKGHPSPFPSTNWVQAIGETKPGLRVALPQALIRVDLAAQARCRSRSRAVSNCIWLLISRRHARMCTPTLCTLLLLLSLSPELTQWLDVAIRILRLARYRQVTGRPVQLQHCAVRRAAILTGFLLSLCVRPLQLSIVQVQPQTGTVFLLCPPLEIP